MIKKKGVSLYDESFCDKLITHMSNGLSFHSFSAVADVVPKTLYNWLKVHEEFRDAKELAEAHCLKFWEEKGIYGLASREFNSVIWIVNMCNRFGWRQRQKDDDDVSDRGPAVAPLSADDLVNIVKKAREV